MSADLLREPAPTIPALALRLKDAARALGVSDRTLWQWHHDGIIPAVRIGGTVLFSVDVLRDWLREESTPAVAEGGNHGQ